MAAPFLPLDVPLTLTHADIPYAGGLLGPAPPGPGGRPRLTVAVRAP